MFYSIEITENSKLVTYSVSENRGTAINEIRHKLEGIRYQPEQGNTVFIVIQANYFDQFGKKQTNYKSGKFYFHKYFTIYSEQFSIGVLNNEMTQRFLIDN